MSNLLSQDEIDALLNDIDRVDEQELPEAIFKLSCAIPVYDFSSHVIVTLACLRNFTTVFRLEVAKSVVEQNYSNTEAVAAINAVKFFVDKWERVLKNDSNNATAKPILMTSEQIKIDELEQRIMRLEVENEVFCNS